MKSYGIAAIAGLLLSNTIVAAAEKDTRAGNCEDAKSQFEYFCKGDSNDIMMQVPIACNNAKKNMAAACDGKTEADQPYKFEETKK
jgi:hypothetical protein